MWLMTWAIRWFALVLAVTAAAMAPLHDTAATEATAVRIGAHAEKTRFVVEFSDNIQFEIFTLADPYRVVVDLDRVDWRVGTETDAKGVIGGYRFGNFEEGRSRIVLDVREPVEIKGAFLIPPGESPRHRLVLDIVSSTRPQFMAALSPPRSEAPPTAATTGAAEEPALGNGATRFSLPGRKPRAAAHKRVVVIDPGHGGVDPGTTGPGGILEKHIVLSMARAIQQKLETTGRYDAYLTREGDEFVRLRDRVGIARAKDADLFMSVHADAIADRRVRGLSVYTLSENASDKEAAALAEKENKADLIAGIDLTDENPEVTNILIDLAQRESMNQSARFAREMVDEIGRVSRLLRKTHRFAGFAVLKAPDVPSVLVEVGFLSNPSDAANLGRPEYRAQLAAAIANSVDRYFDRVEQARRAE
jgi:N-acetylmuramoyl-L-alanine amidase